MRKILSGFLATSMIVAVASSVTFAASAAKVTISANSGDLFTVRGGTFAGQSITTDAGHRAQTSSANWQVKASCSRVTLNLPNAQAGGVQVDIPVSFSDTFSGTIVTRTLPVSTTGGTMVYVTDTQMNGQKILEALNGKTFTVQLDSGIVYTGRMAMKSGDLEITMDQAGALNVTGATITPVSLNYDVQLPNIEIVDNGTGEVTSSNPDSTTWSAVVSAGTGLNPFTFSYTPVNGTGTPVADEDRGGLFESQNLHVNDVIWSDSNGNPIAFTEKLSSVDQDQNTEGGVQGGKTLYFLLRDDSARRVDKLDDDTYWKLKVTKGDNGKYIKEISDVSKTFKDGLYPLNSTGGRAAVTVGRHRYIKVELNDIYTDEEIKMTLDMRITPKTKAVNAGVLVGGQPVTDESEFKVKDFYFYMKNLVKSADNDWSVGVDGLMLSPLENDWNNVVWYDEDGDVAHMKFFADSDVDKFYSKLSTKWEHADYASYFNDQDAFIFNFTGSPKLSSTSRADLEIYNPFIDEDGNETIDPSTAVIYQVIDGDLYDVTDSWKYEEGENGDMAFTTRTRFLGTYIICEKPVEEAVSDDETVPDELTPDTTPEAPEDTTPDNNGGGKAPANTGKYL